MQCALDVEKDIIPFRVIRNSTISSVTSPQAGQHRKGQQIILSEKSEMNIGSFFLGIKWTELETDHLSPSGAEIKKKWVYNSTTPLRVKCMPSDTLLFLIFYIATVKIVNTDFHGVIIHAYILKNLMVA